MTDDVATSGRYDALRVRKGEISLECIRAAARADPKIIGIQSPLFAQWNVLVQITPAELFIHARPQVNPEDPLQGR